MTHRLAGYITEVDDNDRIHITLPAVRNQDEQKKDVLNTHIQLLAAQKKFNDRTTGYSPLYEKSFIAKIISTKTFAYDVKMRQIKVADFKKELTCHNAIIEADFLPFAGTETKGWFIKVFSILLTD